MENAQHAGEMTWLILKLIGQMILNHLPYFIMWVLIGFFVGIIAGIIALKVCKKLGVFSRPAIGSFSKFLNKAYKPIMFLGILFLSLTFFTHLGTTKILEKEIHHGVESAASILEEMFFEDEETRDAMYEMAESVANSGHYVTDFNQAVGEASIQAITQEKHSGFLMSKLSSFIIVDRIAEKLLEYEKAILYFAISKIVESSGISSGTLISAETFAAGIDLWIEADYYEDIKGIVNIISGFIYDQLKPFLFSIFIPFLLIAFILVIIPLVHLLISNRRQKKLINTELVVIPENELKAYSDQNKE